MSGVDWHPPWPPFFEPVCANCGQSSAAHAPAGACPRPKGSATGPAATIEPEPPCPTTQEDRLCADSPEEKRGVTDGQEQEAHRRMREKLELAAVTRRGGYHGDTMGSEHARCGCGGDGKLRHNAYGLCNEVMCEGMDGECAMSSPDCDTPEEAWEIWDRAMSGGGRASEAALSAEQEAHRETRVALGHITHWPCLLSSGHEDSLPCAERPGKAIETYCPPCYATAYLAGPAGPCDDCPHHDDCNDAGGDPHPDCPLTQDQPGGYHGK